MNWHESESTTWCDNAVPPKVFSPLRSDMYLQVTCWNRSLPEATKVSSLRRLSTLRLKKLLRREAWGYRDAVKRNTGHAHAMCISMFREEANSWSSRWCQREARVYSGRNYWDARLSMSSNVQVVLSTMNHWSWIVYKYILQNLWPLFCLESI